MPGLHLALNSHMLPDAVAPEVCRAVDFTDECHS